MIDPTPKELMTFLGCAAFFMTILHQGWKLVEKMRGKKPKPPNEVLAGLANTLKESVKEMFERVEKFEEKNERDHATFDRRIDGLDRKQREHTEQRVEALRKEIDQSLEGIHERINDILKAVSRVEGKISAHGTREGI